MNEFSLVNYDHNVSSEMMSKFDCGNVKINSFLKSSITEVEKSHTYLLIDEDEHNIIGFFSLSTDALLINETESHMYGESAIKIYMFAIDENFQKAKIVIGEKEITFAHLLLNLCINTIQNIVKNTIGASMIVLLSTEAGEGLYCNVGGFEPIEDEMSILEHDNKDNKLIPMARTVFDY